MITVNISYEAEEQILRDSLLESISTLFESINDLLTHETPFEDYIRDDLHDTLKWMFALQTAARYYTPESEWAAIDEFDVDINLVREKLSADNQGDDSDEMKAWFDTLMSFNNPISK